MGDREALLTRLKRAAARLAETNPDRLELLVERAERMAQMPVTFVAHERPQKMD